MSNTPRLSATKLAILHALEADPAAVWISRPIRVGSSPIARWRDGVTVRTVTHTVSVLIAAGLIERGPMPARMTSPIALRVTPAGVRAIGAAIAAAMARDEQ